MSILVSTFLFKKPSSFNLIWQNVSFTVNMGKPKVYFKEILADKTLKNSRLRIQNRSTIVSIPGYRRGQSLPGQGESSQCLMCRILLSLDLVYASSHILSYFAISSCKRTRMFFLKHPCNSHSVFNSRTKFS